MFAHYSIASAGPDFISYQASQDVPDLRGVKKPHNIQVLAILRFFSFGEHQKDLVNQLAQIGTGEGKSLVLGATATLFALLGFPVRVVCYSEYLSNRDAKEFARTFSEFGVAQRIRYSTITSFFDESAAAMGDMRSSTGQVLTGKDFKSQPELGEPPANNLVLLIDEVDFFNSQDFIGRTHDQVVRLPHPSVRKLFLHLWKRRDEAQTWEGERKLCEDMKSSLEYQELVSNFKKIEVVIEHELTMMCKGLYDYLQKTHPMPEFNHVQQCIGIKVQDRIDCGAVFGYKHAFAYLHYQKQPLTEEKWDQVLSLHVPCSEFSYTKFNPPPRHILGVSGTIEHQQPFLKQQVAKHGLALVTIMPPLFGPAKFRFLEQDDAIRQVTEEDYFPEIARTILEMSRASRAIIVFFENELLLDEFRRSPSGTTLPSHQLLLEKHSSEEKDRVITMAANTRQITLATAPFGRGSDFVSYDDKLQENGGVHILQTFPSADSSEEVQFQGRTARQGNKGTYGLILHERHIAQLGLDSNFLLDGQSHLGFHRGFCDLGLKVVCCA